MDWVKELNDHNRFTIFYGKVHASETNPMISLRDVEAFIQSLLDEKEKEIRKEYEG